MSLFIDDTGCVIEVTVTEGGQPVGIGTTVTDQRTILWRHPNGIVYEKTGTLVTDGSDGKMKFTIGAGDLPDAGTYTVQGRILWKTTGYLTHTTTGTVECVRPLDG